MTLIACTVAAHVYIMYFCKRQAGHSVLHGKGMYGWGERWHNTCSSDEAEIQIKICYTIRGSFVRAQPLHAQLHMPANLG